MLDATSQHINEIHEHSTRERVCYFVEFSAFCREHFWAILVEIYYPHYIQLRYFLAAARREGGRRKGAEEREKERESKKGKNK